ncbi:MAG: hypothetical protein ACP5I7_03390 [Sulfolobales archaeon]
MINKLLRKPIDHDLVIDKYLNIHVVFGSIHPLGRIYSYPKYTFSSNTREASLWKYRGVYLERVVQRYSVEYVVDAIKRYDIPTIYEPAYGVAMPYVSYSDILEYLYPEKRLHEIYENPKTLLEIRLAEFVDDLRSNLNIELGRIGVSGSILGRFSNDLYSDIDVVIYGCENISRIYENIDSVLRPLKDKELERYITNLALLHKIDLETARKLYRTYRRGVYKDKNISIIFPSDPCEYPCRLMSQPLSCVSIKLYVPEKQCKALQYPGEAYVEKVLDKDLSNYDIRKIILYEGIFSPIIYEGGVLLVQGALQRLYDFSTNEAYYIVSVGSRECSYMVKKLETW